MQGIDAAAPSIAMIGAFACVAGGVWQLRRGPDRRKGWLLIVMAAVLVANVLVWTL